jgi:predicted ATPase with chaperone activity
VCCLRVVVLDTSSKSFFGGIDIHIEVLRVDFEELLDSRRGESSDEIRARVEQAG